MGGITGEWVGGRGDRLSSSSLLGLGLLLGLLLVGEKVMTRLLIRRNGEREVRGGFWEEHVGSKIVIEYLE